MCPFCIATTAMTVAGVTSAGGLTVFVATKLRFSKEKKMSYLRVVSQDEWLTERKALLAKEKAFTRDRDALSTERRNLPMVKVEKRYVFDGSEGQRTLRDLFGTRPQLIVYHFMFDPSWDEGCKSCSYFADNFSGAIIHLAAANTAFAVVSKAPIDKIEAFKKRMGWTFPWFSSFRNDFNQDFHVTLDEKNAEYNYHDAAELKAAGKIWIEKGELPGLTVFLRDGNNILHTYSTYQQGLDLLINTYNDLDLTPLGRSEQRPMEWVRHHDKYATEQV